MIELERVRRIARQVSRRYGLTVPVDLKPVLDACCIYREEELQYGVDGYTDFNDKPPVMYINSEIDYSRRVKFTVAHELGHIFIPWHNGSTTFGGHEGLMRNGVRLIDKNELEADTFASELLLPRDWVEEEISRHDARGVERLMQSVISQSNVSFMACLHALIDAWPPGHVLFITLPTWEYWRCFTSQDTQLLRLWRDGGDRAEQFDYYDLCSIEKSVFTHGSYTVRHYHFMEMPGDICGIYESCDSKLDLLIDSITDFQPLYAVPLLDRLVWELPGTQTVLLELDGYNVKMISGKNSTLRHALSDGDDLDFDSIKEVLIHTGSHSAFDEMDLDGCGRLFWIKEKVLDIPPATQEDPNQLLARILRDSYDEEDAVRVRNKVNGIIGAANNSCAAEDRDQLYTYLRNRLLTNELFSPLCEDYRFEEFLANKVDRLMKGR